MLILKLLQKWDVPCMQHRSFTMWSSIPSFPSGIPSRLFARTNRLFLRFVCGHGINLPCKHAYQFNGFLYDYVQGPWCKADRL